MTILHKIANIPDEQCQGCSQLFEGECRAFTMAHGSEEAKQRASGIPHCKYAMTVEQRIEADFIQTKGETK
jgi:hypothetical protein